MLDGMAVHRAIAGGGINRFRKRAGHPVFIVANRMSEKLKTIMPLWKWGGYSFAPWPAPYFGHHQAKCSSGSFLSIDCFDIIAIWIE